MALDGEQVTLTEFWASMMSLHEKMDGVRGDMDQIREDISDVKQEFSGMKQRIYNIEVNAANTNDRVQVLETKTDSVIGRVDTAEDNIIAMKEQLDRIRREGNLMLFGVAENERGLETAVALLQLILPDHTGGFPMQRIGERNESKKRPRPLKVQLSNSGEKYIGLGNCHLLKGMDNFKGISVKPDYTKMQIVTRSQSRKRKQDDEQAAADSAKKSKQQVDGEEVPQNDHEEMEDN